MDVYKKFHIFLSEYTNKKIGHAEFERNMDINQHELRGSLILQGEDYKDPEQSSIQSAQILRACGYDYI